MNVVVAYDVSDDDRRARLAAILSHHGVRLQRSVFECIVDEESYAPLVALAQSVINHNRDVLQFFHQCDACRPRRMDAGQVNSTLHDYFWVV